MISAAEKSSFVEGLNKMRVRPAGENRRETLKITNIYVRELKNDYYDITGHLEINNEFIIKYSLRECGGFSTSSIWIPKSGYCYLHDKSKQDKARELYTNALEFIKFDVQNAFDSAKQSGLFKV